MSHVVDLGLEINDRESLEMAAQMLGMDCREKNTFKWFGTHVGDYPLPAGFKKEDMGKCDFALGVTGNDKAYEIGVVKRRDGKPGYQLLWDFWAGGHGLEKAIGKDGGLLKQEYSAQVQMKEARRLGLRVKRSTDEQGRIRLQVRS